MLSDQFIGGFISACGTFFEYTKRGKTYPAFQIKTSYENAPLLNQIASTLQLYTQVYTIRHGDVTYAQLITRSRNQILNNLVPLFDQYLQGHKSIVYKDWKARMFENCSTWNYRNVTSSSNPEKHTLGDKKPNKA